MCKRIFLFITAMALLLCAASCKERVTFDTDYMEVELADEQFFGLPEIIFKGTVTEVVDAYFTNPDGEDYTNAHITVFELKVSDVYKGRWEEETFEVKMFNGEGMSKDLYLYGEDDKYILDEEIEKFLLEEGKEYILGVVSLDLEKYNTYGEEDGYAIQTGKGWTFVQNEAGLYENLKEGTNHRTFDIATLKEKVAALPQK